MTDTFKVAFLGKLNSPLEIEEATFSSLGYGQVRVKIEAFGICGSQLSEIEGRKDNSKFLPHLMGHEGVGTIVEKHPSVTKVAPGERVVIHWRKGHGLEGGPVSLTTKTGVKVGGGPATTFAEFTTVGENRVTKVPDWLETEAAVLLGCGVSTGFGAVDKNVQMRLGSSVLVLGLGGVGMSVGLAAALKGASPLVGFDLNVKKMDIASKLGFHAFVPDAEDLFNSVQTGDNGYDFVFEVTGNLDLRRNLARFLKPGGTAVIIGQHSPLSQIEFGEEKFAFGSEGNSFVFTQGGGFVPDEDIPQWGSLLSRESGRLGALSESFTGELERVNELISRMTNGEVLGRPILKIGLTT